MSAFNTGARTVQPMIRKIGVADLGDALAKGFDDFKAKPSHVMLLVIIYPLVGLFSFKLMSGREVIPLLFPLAAGFALIGPVAAIVLYELSRIREQGLEYSWSDAVGVFRKPSIVAIIMLGAVQLVIYFAWLGAAIAIYRLTFGDAVPTSVAGFTYDVFYTSSGWALILLGCGVGFLFAVLVLTISVVSFPMLVDRNVGARVAIRTSVRAVLTNPTTMAIWGLIVAVALVIGSLPFFIGLAVVMPVLGHATWHLYRKIVEL